MTATAPTMLHAFPLHPPAAWFDTLPDWFSPGEKLTVMTDGPDAGRVAGTVAPRDQCLLDGTRDCLTVPYSPTAYAAAHQGDTLTAEGSIIHTANIGGGVNHARLSAGFREAVKHYENTAAQVMRVRYHDLEDCVIALGALWPDVTDEQVAVVRAAALSGDWRWRPELNALDMSGVQLVNNPGYPLMRRAQPRAAGVVEVIVGGLGGPGEFDTDDTCPTCGTPSDLAARVADLEGALAQLAAR